MDVFAIVCQCIALISGIRYYRRKKEGLYFIIYIFSWLISFTVVEWIVTYFQVIGRQYNRAILFEETCITIASMIEFCCFSYYFHNIFKFQKNKRLVKVLAAIFIVPVVFFFEKLVTGGSAAQVTQLSFVISSVALFLLAISCLLYYSELLTKPFTERLFKRPSFVIITSFLLYCVLVVPFFLLANRFVKTNSSVYFAGFTIHLTSFCLLFLAMTWAFRLNKSLTD